MQLLGERDEVAQVSDVQSTLPGEDADRPEPRDDRPA